MSLYVYINLDRGSSILHHAGPATFCIFWSWDIMSCTMMLTWCGWQIHFHIWRGITMCISLTTWQLYAHHSFPFRIEFFMFIIFSWASLCKSGQASGPFPCPAAPGEEGQDVHLQLHDFPPAHRRSEEGNEEVDRGNAAPTVVYNDEVK